MTARPVIGIVASAYVVTKHFGDLAVLGAPGRYVEQVAAAGARPILVPAATAGDLLDVVDGLVLIGGGDVDPLRYGGSPGPAFDVDPARDDAEINLVHAAAAADMPLLGVCRGLQVLAVAFGGTLTGDLGMSHVLPGDTHSVSTQPGSLVNSLLGARPGVTALHHQAVAEPGPCWHATAWADDGVAEAIEWSGDRTWPALGVQWHPELEDSTGATLFGWLVRAAGAPDSRPTASIAVPPVGIEPTLSRF